MSFFRHYYSSFTFVSVPSNSSLAFTASFFYIHLTFPFSSAIIAVVNIFLFAVRLYSYFFVSCEPVLAEDPDIAGNVIGKTYASAAFANYQLLT